MVNKPISFSTTYKAETEYIVQLHAGDKNWHWWSETKDNTEALKDAENLIKSSQRPVRIIKRTMITTEEQYWPTPMCSHEGCEKYAAQGWRTCSQHISDCF